MTLPKHITKHHSFYTTTKGLRNPVPNTTVNVVYFCHHCSQYLTNPEEYAKHSTTCSQRR